MPAADFSELRISWKPIPLAGNPNIPTVPHNGTIAPLIPFAIKGTVWCQGESNTEQARHYSSLFPATIRPQKANSPE